MTKNESTEQIQDEESRLLSDLERIDEKLKTQARSSTPYREHQTDKCDYLKPPQAYNFRQLVSETQSSIPFTKEHKFASTA